MPKSELSNLFTVHQDPAHQWPRCDLRARAITGEMQLLIL